MTGLHAQAFKLAASELGMASASWLFVRETAAENGPEGVVTLRDQLGRTWPVLDAVCAGWLNGQRVAHFHSRQLETRLQGIRKIVFVGHEAHWLDALLTQLPPGIPVGLVQEGESTSTQWTRVFANYRGRVEPLTLTNFQAWAGARSVLVGFVYGSPGQQFFVPPTWLRAAGSDVRLQFQALLGWRVLGLPLEIYPRWLVATDPHTFTDLFD